MSLDVNRSSVKANLNFIHSFTREFIVKREGRDPSLFSLFSPLLHRVKPTVYFCYKTTEGYRVKRQVNWINGLDGLGLNLGEVVLPLS